MEPDRILRSIRFDNGAGAYVRLQDSFHCAECTGSCDEACILPEKRFSIRTLFEQLHQDYHVDKAVLNDKPVKPIALRFIYEMASCEALKNVPISGMGGIETWRDAAEFLLLKHSALPGFGKG